MSNNHKYWTQARPLHGTAHDEQTPLTCNSSNNPADSIKTTTSIISDDRHSCCPCLWNRACIVVLSAIIAAALIFVSLAMLIDDQHKLSSSSAMNALKIVSIDGDVLQWCTLLASFVLSVSSFCIATTNSKRIRNNTDIVTKLQQQQFSHLHYYSSEDAKLKATQQQTMLSLAILVSNYADLFVMANQQLRRYNNSSNSNNNNKQNLFIFPALTISCTQMLDEINKAFATGLTREITNSHMPDGKRQFTLYTARLLDATTVTTTTISSGSGYNHYLHHNEKSSSSSSSSDNDKWLNRDIVEGNERLLIQIMSYLTNNNEFIGGEVAVNSVIDRIDGLLDVHLHLLEQQQQQQQQR